MLLRVAAMTQGDNRKQRRCCGGGAFAVFEIGNLEICDFDGLFTPPVRRREQPIDS